MSSDCPRFQPQPLMMIPHILMMLLQLQVFLEENQEQTQWQQTKMASRWMSSDCPRFQPQIEIFLYIVPTAITLCVPSAIMSNLAKNLSKYVKFHDVCLKPNQIFIFKSQTR